MWPVIVIGMSCVLAVGLGAFILWFKDRVPMVQQVLGAIVLCLGVVLAGWILYNVFGPTREFERATVRGAYLAFPIAMIAVGGRWLFRRSAGIEEVEVDFQSPELLGTIARAQDTLPYFIEQVQQNVDGAFIKFPITTDQGCTEHIWGYVHHYANESFNISLANDPYSQKGEFENRFSVAESDVEDWQIMLPDGRLKGAYSIIGSFEYLENRGRKVTKTMRAQRQLLIDAPPLKSGNH